MPRVETIEVVWKRFERCEQMLLELGVIHEGKCLECSDTEDKVLVCGPFFEEGDFPLAWQLARDHCTREQLAIEVRALPQYGLVNLRESVGVLRTECIKDDLVRPWQLLTVENDAL